MTETNVISKKEYKGDLNYEAVLAGQVNRIAVYRDMSPRQYASSVESYALMCPPEICDKALSKLESLGLHRCNYENINSDRMVLYDDLFRYVNLCLMKDAGLIFKTSSYEIGIE